MGSPLRPLLALALPLAIEVVGLAACTATLPLDTLTGGPARPVSLYHFEDGSGQIARDAFGKNEADLQQEVTPPTWTKDGKRGGGVSFGEDGWIVVPTLSGLNSPQRGTVAVWVKMRSLDRDGAEMFGLEQDTSSDESDEITTLGMFANDTAVLLQFQQRGTQPAFFSTPSSIPKDHWTLLAIGWDFSAQQAYIYARPDGEPPLPIQSATFPNGFHVDQASFYLGARNGTLDEVAFYDHMLPASELARLE